MTRKRRPGRTRLLLELTRVDAISDEKYNQDWQEGLPFMYCFWKILSHLIKWLFAGKGSRNGSTRAHHIGKVGWYAGEILLTEDIRPDLDDRPEPRKATKKVIEGTVNSIFKLLEVPAPKKFKRKAPQPKPDC